MKLDGPIPKALADVGDAAVELERSGYAGGWVAETDHDPFLPLILAADRTTTLEVGTSIAVAFARNPMTLANTAWDLQAFSQGRFFLGLGSQIKPHITKRFSMEWSHPAARMREMILAIRAIWETWLHGAELDFRGEFYTHTLMTPHFAPDPADLAGCGAPKILLAGVGELMTEVAGEVADGFLCHGFTTERYLRDVTLPALERGRAKADATLIGFDVKLPAFVVTGADERQISAAALRTRERIAFYASTPAYRKVLDVHGWGGLQGELNALSKQGEWAEMATLIDDDVLDAFAIVGSPDEIATRLQARYGDVVDRVTLYTPYRVDPDVLASVVAGFLTGTPGRQPPP